MNKSSVYPRYMNSLCGSVVERLTRIFNNAYEKVRGSIPRGGSIFLHNFFYITILPVADHIKYPLF